MYDKWRHVWVLSWERQRELYEHLAYLKEKERWKKRKSERKKEKQRDREREREREKGEKGKEINKIYLERI